MMFNKYFTEKDALILIGSFLFSIGLAVLTLYLDPEAMGLRPWLEPMGIFVLALAAIAPQSGTGTELSHVSSYGLAVAALSFLYWAVLFATIFIARKRIIRRRDLERRRQQKATADRLLGRDPDAFPLPDDPERKKQ